MHVRGIARGGQGVPPAPGAVIGGRQESNIQCIHVHLQSLPIGSQKETTVLNNIKLLRQTL